jgi:hypothetical protein
MFPRWLVPGLPNRRALDDLPGQRQAMFIERMPGLAEVILSTSFGPRRGDGLLRRRLSAVPVEWPAAPVSAACG